MLTIVVLKPEYSGTTMAANALAYVTSGPF